MRVLLFMREYDVFRYIRTLHEVRPSSAFVRYWLVQGFKVYGISRSSNRISIDISCVHKSTLLTNRIYKVF
jgi:hypothetical protein